MNWGACHLLVPFHHRLSSSMSTAFYHLSSPWSSHLSEVRLVNFVFGPSSEHLRRAWSKVRPFMQIHVCCSVAKLHPTLCVTPWTAAHQASWSFHISWSLLKFMSIQSVMLSNHLILCLPLLLLLSVFPSIRVFSNESAPRIRWSKYWSFSISLSNEYSGLISFRATAYGVTESDTT